MIRVQRPQVRGNTALAYDYEVEAEPEMLEIPHGAAQDPAAAQREDLPLAGRRPVNAGFLLLRRRERRRQAVLHVPLPRRVPAGVRSPPLGQPAAVPELGFCGCENEGPEGNLRLFLFYPPRRGRVASDSERGGVKAACRSSPHPDCFRFAQAVDPPPPGEGEDRAAHHRFNFKQRRLSRRDSSPVFFAAPGRPSLDLAFQLRPR